MADDLRRSAAGQRVGGIGDGRAPTALSVPAGGLLFDALAAGPPDGPLVLLLHGFAQPLTAWAPQLGALASAGLRAVAPAQRGYAPGARPAMVAAYRIQHLVDDVVAIAAALGRTRFHAAGFDNGGAVAWHLAAARPDAVLSLTALSTPHPRALVRALAGGQSLRSAYIPAFWVPRLPERVLGAGGGALLRRLLAAAGLPPDRASAYAAGLAGHRDLAGALAFYRAMRPWALQGVGNVAVPTVHVWGSANRVIGRRATAGTARYVGGRYRLSVCDAAGHWLVETRPAAVTEAILDAVGAAREG